MRHKKILSCAILGVCVGLVACQSEPVLAPHSSSQASGVAAEVKFIDLKKFDHDLYHALHSSDAEVKVVMYEKVSPNNTPDRLQKWLNAVEKNGGKVEIEPPPNELVSKNPFVLIGLVGSLWDAVKAVADFRDSQLTHAVKGHDAVISLERNQRGEIVVSKLTFKKK